jgi:hypothetical protein
MCNGDDLRAPGTEAYFLVQSWAITTSTSIGTCVRSVRPACFMIISNRVAASSAWASGTSRMISSCTVTMIRAPVPFRAGGKRPSARVRMSAPVPYTGVFRSSVRGG